MFAALAEIILENEKNDYRFENFTREICEKNEGIAFVPTSQSWDRGRDARSTSPGRGSHRNLICSTLNKEVNAKIDSDLLRVTATSSPDRLVYCSSQRLSEEKIDEVTNMIRRHVPSGSVLVLGAMQLATLAEKWGDIFDKYYHAESHAIRTSILERPPDESRSTRGLRLALIAFGSDEAAALRHQVLNDSVFDFFTDHKPHNISEIAETLSSDLGLPRPLRPEMVRRVIEVEQRAGTLQTVGDKWVITEFGKQRANAGPVKAVTNLLEGRQVVREQLEKEIGKKIEDNQFEQIWAGLIDFLSGLFHANGLSVIKAVDQFLSGKSSDSTEDPNLRGLLTEGIGRVISVIQTKELRETVGFAILDMLTERSGPAFDWLTRVAERFVVLCSLGLESKSSEEIHQALTSHQVILDTDIILSYLCEGETEHKRSKELLSRWLQLGGRLLVAPTVLEEVAYHAWISERDFRETEHLLGKLHRYELPRLIKSAFVRTYHTLEKSPGRWPQYIGMFKGNSSGDYTKILTILRQRLKVESLPEAYDEGLRKAITDYLMTLARRDGYRGAEQLEDISYKVERDGKLLASISHGRIAQERLGTSGPIVLLSSSHPLAMTESHFKDAFGEARVLFSIGALSFLLATVPDTPLGADSLRRALFEFGGTARLSDSGRRALRIIRSTGGYDIPWATRGLLQANLSAAIRSEAEKRGIDENQMRTQLASGTEPKTAAKLIVDSLREMAIKDKTQEQLAETERKVAALEDKIEVLEEALKSANTRGSAVGPK